jgi:apolipoprotein N-acyltransferase
LPSSAKRRSSGAGDRAGRPSPPTPARGSAGKGDGLPQTLENAERPGARLRAVLSELLLLVLSSLLFSLSFPNFLSRWGYFPLAFLALAPMFAVIRRCGWLRCILYGAFFGFASYALFNFWLAKFHPLALLIVPPIHSFYFLLLFPLLKAAVTFFPVHGYLLQSLIWVGYEFLKTQGFLAYSYGNLGYSQYLFLPLLQLASLAGVWGVSLLVVFPSAFLGSLWIAGPSARFRTKTRFAVLHGLPLAGYGLLLLLAIGWGLVSQVDLAGARPWKVALVQQNVDPWRGGYRAYRQSLDILVRQSERALREKPEIVIWSETSFVPAIDWHTRYRQDPEAYRLVRELRDYLSEQEVPFVVGNDDGQLKRTETGEERRVDYNATLLFQGGEIVQTYRKLHLVPFTEYFPYRNTLPRVYEWLRNADTHFWEKGTEHTVFEAAGVRFSTPICFEDTFGYLNREFVRAGAEVLVNMTNDSWSNSVAAEMQHMSMSVIRAVENRRSVVRATNGGITGIIDPNGRLRSMLPPFIEGYLIGDVPVHAQVTTLYTRWGDWFGRLVLLAALLGVTWGAVRALAARTPRPGVGTQTPRPEVGTQTPTAGTPAAGAPGKRRKKD